jgi:nucleoid DNA-binding protein
VTKKEIVKQISDRANLTQLKTKEIVQWTFDAIVDTLIEEGRIELRNFGVFEVKRRKARKARNPRTGARVDVEPKNVVTFQPGKEMEERVRLMATVPDRPRGRGARDQSDDEADAEPAGSVETAAAASAPA